MKNLTVILTSALLVVGLGACQETCGTCYITVGGVEEPDTRKQEMCEEAYETLKESGEPERKTWEQIYPGEEVKYVCEEN